MNFDFKIDISSQTPIYRQIMDNIENAVKNGTLVEGTQVPSMNEYAAKEGISRETVKKAYVMLVKRGYLISHHGKGFFVHKPEEAKAKSVLVIIDRLSIYRQITLRAFNDALGENGQVTILTHNQSIDLLEYYLSNNLDNFDYYVISPHFALDEATQTRVTALLQRVPNRKLVLLDKLQDGLKGNFGAVYQDFKNDIGLGLAQGRNMLRQVGRLRVITLPDSLYGEQMIPRVEQFCGEISLPVDFSTVIPQDIRRGDCFLIINSQLDWGLNVLARRIASQGFSVGDDVKIICYNEFPACELVLGGLTTMSADFNLMGVLAAEMVLSGKLSKQKCDFLLIRRHSF